MVRYEARRIWQGTRWSVGLLGLLAVCGVPSCGGGDGSLVNPCESELECGQPCDAGKPCGSGTHCGVENTCTAQCVRGDARCGSGKTCDGSGHCGDAITLGLGGSSGVGGSGSICADFDITLDKQIPTVLLLVDQSGSMDQPFGNSDRWRVLRGALMNQQTGIVNRLQAEVRFGLALYSSRNGAAPCPTITDVAPALNNFMAIDDAYPAPTSSIIEDTPTGESIDVASTILQGIDEPGQKIIVLATDGQPDTCDNPDPETPAAEEVSIEAAQAAFAAGVFTFVISVGNDVSDQHLTEMANVGQGFDRGDNQQRFYRANSQNDLAEAFDTIINGVRSCVFALNGSVKAGAEANGRVTLDGKALQLNDPNGWRLSSPTTIEFQGDACDAIKTGDHKVGAAFTCEDFVPTEPPS